MRTTGICVCVHNHAFTLPTKASLLPAPGHKLQKVGEVCFRVLALLPNFVSPADLISIPFNLSSKSLVKIIKE